MVKQVKQGWICRGSILDKSCCQGQSCCNVYVLNVTYTGRRQRADPELSLEGSMKGRGAAMRNWQMWGQSQPG